MTVAAPPQSIYQTIFSDIERRILSGEWPPGHRISSEKELSEEYGCSRMTVNKALSQLAREGYIQRRRRAGSVVIRPHVQSAVLEIHEIRTEIESLGLPYRYALLTRAQRPIRSCRRDPARCRDFRSPAGADRPALGRDDAILLRGAVDQSRGRAGGG